MGNICGKLCVLGQVGFPKRLPDCCQTGGFPLKSSTHRCRRQYAYVGTDNVTWLPLSTHYNPAYVPDMPTGLGDFLNNHYRFLASFAAMVSSGDSKAFHGRETLAWSAIHHTHSRQATLPTARFFAPQRRFHPNTYIGRILTDARS